MQASDASGAEKTGADKTSGRGTLALGVALGVVLLGGGSLVVGAGGLLYWQYMRGESTVDGAPGMLAIINERSGPVKVVCKGEGAGGAEREAEIPASGVGNIEVPVRPANCSGTVVGEGEAEVLRWHASSPPAVDEVWTVRIPALSPLQTGPLQMDPLQTAPTGDVAAVGLEGAAGEGAPTEAVPLGAAYTLDIYSERADTVKVKCQDVGSPEPGAVIEIPPATSGRVMVGKLTHCSGTAKDGTLVWMWEVKAPPADGSSVLHATISGPAGEMLSGGAAKAGSTTSSAAKTSSASTKSRTPEASTSGAGTAGASTAGASTAGASTAPAPDASTSASAASTSMSLVKFEVKKAAKLKGAKLTVDGDVVPYPGQMALGLGIHTMKMQKDGVIDLACPLVASGKDITVVLDPDKPVCP